MILCYNPFKKAIWTVPIVANKLSICSTTSNLTMLLISLHSWINVRAHLLDALSLYYMQLLHSGCIHYRIIMMTLLCAEAVSPMHNILCQEVISCNVHNYNVFHLFAAWCMMIMDLFVWVVPWYKKYFRMNAQIVAANLKTPRLRKAVHSLYRILLHK